MPAEPETEVILCPACKHTLRVPVEWLGTQVQCPECKAMFRAPTRDGSGGLTEAVLMSRPEARGAATKKSMDWMLLLPAFGLMTLGIAAGFVNGRTAYMVFTDPQAVNEVVQKQLPGMRNFGIGKEDPEAERPQLDRERAEEVVRAMRWAMPLFTGIAVLTFLGGLSIATRWNYRLAQLGSLAAMLNFPNCCCVPGAVVGGWALLMLGSDEARGHFGRARI